LLGLSGILLAGITPAAASTSTTKQTSSPAASLPHASKTHGANSTHHAATKSAAKPTGHTSANTPAHSKSSPSSNGSRSNSSSRKSAKVPAKRGQQVVDSARAREIQGALIREHYLDGEPSGVWDSATQSAMQRYQEDRGWQSKTVPDSRALIRLGLGPSHDHLLNPESAMTASVPEPAADSDSKTFSKPNPDSITISRPDKTTATHVAPTAAEPSQPHF
jgi:hypothetical protein